MVLVVVEQYKNLKQMNKSIIFVYFKNGNVFQYEVESAIKAREHAEKIWSFGFRTMINTRMEWFGSHYIDKICWTNDDTILVKKYEKE